VRWEAVREGDLPFERHSQLAALLRAAFAHFPEYYAGSCPHAGSATPGTTPASRDPSWTRSATPRWSSRSAPAWTTGRAGTSAGTAPRS